MDGPEDEEQLIYNAPGPSTFSYDPQAVGGVNGGPESDDEDSGMEFEEVGGIEDLADAPKQRAAEEQDRPLADDDAPIAERTHIPSSGPSEALEIVLEKANIPQLKDKKASKKPVIPGSDRKSRIQIHNVNLLCLLVAIRIRAQLLFHDAELQCRILSQVPSTVITPFQTAKSLNTPIDRSRGFEAALQDLVSWWWRSFQVDPSIPGLQTITFGKALSAFPVPELPLDEDTSLTDKQKRKILSKIPGDHIRGAKSLSLRAVEMAGSRDISPQLFVSLCTALEVPARLVVSLQPLDWRSAGPLPTDEDADGTAESQAESLASASKPDKRKKGKGKARNSTPKPKQPSNLAKRVGLSAPLPSRFQNRSKTASVATDDSDIEMEEVAIGPAAASPSPGGFLAEQADISEALRHAGPAPSLRRSKAKLRNLEKSPSPDIRDLQKKPVYWVEVYNRSLKEWVTVDVTRKKVRCQGDMEPNKTDETNKMAYVVAIEQDGSIRDVTARYTRAYGAITLKNRPPTPRGEQDWWDRILTPFKRARTLDRDREEERQMSRNQTQEAMPTSIAGFKDHPLFALERHLKREEAIYPQKQLGLIRDEAVYPRSSVVTVKSAEQWMREGLKVKEGEQPLKMVKSRAVTINRRRVHELAKSEGREEDTLQGLYARWQTVKSIPPPVVDGIVPRNGYGNLDLFAPHMLPAGGVHLPYKGIAKVAKQLGIDFAEAITGFDFHKRRAIPTIDGIVVAKENEDVVMEGYWESEHAAVEKAHSKKQEECLKRWKKLIAGLAIRSRLASEYAPTASTSASTFKEEDEAGPYIDKSRFTNIELNEDESAAVAAPSVQEPVRPARLRLTHNSALPPSVAEAQARKRRRQSTSSDESEVESSEEAKLAPVKKASARPPRRQASRNPNMETTVLDQHSDESDSGSEFEEVTAVSTRQRRKAQGDSVAATRPRRSTAGRNGARETSRTLRSPDFNSPTTFMSENALQPACIAEGDLVIIYFSKDQLVPVIVEKGKQVTSRYGYYPHDSMIDVPFGSKVASKTGKGFAYLLKPTPELWTVSLPHRTQILYMPDIAFITSYLNVLPGSRIIEAGTGSGSFSHSVARTIGSAGSLFSFEFHEERFKAAREEFEQHKLPQIKIEHRNVCKDGFPQDLDNSIDGIFLDLPAPWEAVEAAKKALRKDRPSRICCFSPCIEQVLRTVTALGSSGFQEITMFEALVKTHDQVVLSEPPATIFDVMNRLKSVEEHKEARRQRQIERAQAAREPQPSGSDKAQEGDGELSEKRTRDDEDQEDVDQGPSKRARLDATQDGDTVSSSNTPAQTDAEGADGALSKTKGLDPKAKVARPTTNTRAKITKGSALPEGAQVHSRVLPQHRGHTSYLTFATLLPLRSDASPEEAALGKEENAQSTTATAEEHQSMSESKPTSGEPQPGQESQNDISRESRSGSLEQAEGAADQAQ